MDKQSLKYLALDWIDSWNKKDVERIMNHYSDDVIFYSPTVIERWNIADGKIAGKQKLKEHFLKGFELVPDLHFEFIAVLKGVDGILIIYKRENNKIVADFIVLDERNKCKMVKAYYAVSES